MILIPEIPYDIQAVVEAIRKRAEEGKGFCVLAVAEGAISKPDSILKKKEYRQRLKTLPYPSISYKIGKEIEELTGQEVRIAVPGHTQRGGRPCAMDRVLATRLGSAAGQLVLQEQFGYMVGIQNDKIVPVPLEDVAGKLKRVDPDGPMVKDAKELGIQFGDSNEF